MAGKILIIDDDRDITQIIRILLEGEGFETCTAYSGAQALASLDETVELIILDIMMDGMNGFEACHRIRESSYVPILFLSAMSGDSEKVAALMAGGDDYLCKPFSAAELTARVSAPWLPEYGCGDFFTDVEELYRRYKHSIPSERSQSKSRRYFMALPESDLEDGDMLYGQHRDTAQFELEFYILCRIIGGFTWNPETMGKWFWQSEKDKDLVILRKWVEPGSNQLLTNSQ